MKFPKFTKLNTDKKAANHGDSTDANMPSSQNPNQNVLYVDKPEEIPIAKPDIKNPNIDLYLKNLSVPDVIAPKKADMDFTYIKINDTYFRTIFVGGYPRFVSAGWLEPNINFYGSLEVSFFVYP